ncbi:MAG: hypothetical protein A2X56_05100 [Nitrospirae bacterium GWC2_57_13]|jgi:LPS-assembly protein|nr:MAG: hypothetical protein A2072_01200 [Nitrospirae bacterium GWC1_57_7]OGW27272.1 MAG: hypothetical protein A2X56_05100 [Nitrospirae bacterium GWC2_57_13]HAS55385.1 hypothetical protein [Nitrospiraceae bacterium]
MPDEKVKSVNLAMQTMKMIIVPVLLFAGFLLGRPDAALAQEPAGKIPVTVKADNLDYDRTNDRYVAVGNVKIEQEGLLLEADRIVLDNRTGEALAEGSVYFRDNSGVLRAEKLQMNINTKSGLIYRGELFMSKDNYHLKGERIERLGESVYRIENGSFTTCDDEEWYLKAREINVDMNRYATGRGVSFNMGGVPLFYTPYLLFPVRRQSGLLIPEAGFSSSEGFLMKNALFWAISDSRDMTLYSDYRDRLGHGTGVDFRYVSSRDSSGRAYYKYFDRRDSDQYLWEFSLQHREEFAEDLSARVDINLVSDHLYYQTLEKKLELRSRPYLDSNVFYVERWDTAALYLAGQYSTDLTQLNDVTIQKLPELRYTIFQERIAGPLHLSFDGSAVNFSRQQGNGLRRADFGPQFSALFGRSGVSFTPRAGVRATFYDQGETTPEPVERQYFFGGADLNARLSRVYGAESDAGIGKIRHSIEPTVSYNYISRIDRAEIPQFDSVDAVTAENLMTFALINRFTAQYREGAAVRNYDMLIMRFSQSYDLHIARNGALPNEQTRSALRGEVYLRTPKLLTLSANGEYDTYIDRLKSSSESVTVNGEVIQFDVTHRYLREPRTEFLIGGAGAKLRKWSVSARLWHDLENKTTTQEEYRAQYGSQCWGLGVAYVSKPGETQYLFSLELKGIGAVKF